MFTQVVAQKTTDWLVRCGGVKEEEREVYMFGLDKFFSCLVNFFFAVILGLLFGVLLQTVVFYVTYMMLRVYAGGYHAEKSLTCFFASIGVLIPCLVAIRFYQAWNIPTVFYGLLGLGAITLMALGPVEHKNKPLDSAEKVVYRRRMLRNLSIAVVGAGSLLALSLDSYGIAVLCGVLLSAITAGVGKLKPAT